MKRFCVKYGMLIVITLSMAAAGWGLAYAMLDADKTVTVDCRGRNIDVESLRRMEQQQKDGYLGLVGIAGWRVEDQGEVTSVSTGKRQRTKVTGVYGPMDMVYPAKILSGSYGLAVERGYCVLSEGLAYELFGDTDIAGEQCRFGGEILTVAGVIEKKEMILMRPVTEGRMEQLSLEFKSRRNMEKKVKELLGEF